MSQEDIMQSVEVFKDATVNSTAYMVWNNICFSTYFDWKKMISDIGVDRIKKYLFEVK